MEIFNLVWAIIGALMALIFVLVVLIHVNEWNKKFSKWSHDFTQKRRSKKLEKLKFKWEQLKKDKD